MMPKLLAAAGRVVIVDAEEGERQRRSGWTFKSERLNIERLNIERFQ